MSVPHKLIVKLFAAEDTFGHADFVPVFHRIIQAGSFPGHLLIDVADYAHVPDGPGSLLVTSEANVHMDRTEGQLGVSYVRKLPVPDATSIGQVLDAVLRHALVAADLLERDADLAGRLRFRTDEISVRFNDRLITPNAPETVADYQPHVLDAAKRLLGDATEVKPHNTSPRQLLDLRILTPDAPSVAALLTKGK